MRSLLIILISLLVLTSSYSAFAVSSSVQLTKTNIHKDYTFIVIKTEESHEASGNLKLVRVFVTPPNGVKPENVTGHLSAYLNGKLIVSCDVHSRRLTRNSKDLDASVRERSVMLEFSISADCIASSKFEVNLGEPEASAFSNYWFYLKDFADAQ